jgi:hypothetical protein
MIFDKCELALVELLPLRECRGGCGAPGTPFFEDYPPVNSASSQSAAVAIDSPSVRNARLKNPVTEESAFFVAM